MFIIGPDYSLVNALSIANDETQVTANAYSLGFSLQNINCTVHYSETFDVLTS